MFFELGPFNDPLSQRRNVRVRELTAFGRRRHPLVSIIRSNPPPQLTLVEVAGNNHRSAAAIRRNRLRRVEPQVPLPLLRIRAMALKTMIGQDRPHVTIEFDRSRLRAAGCATCCEQREHAAMASKPPRAGK
jgi:hypothetical protein